MVMLVFWGLAIWHCELEELPGLAFLSCCQHPDSAPHQDNDCRQDACSTVESGFYKISHHRAAAPPPLLWLSYLLPDATPSAATTAAAFIAAGAPPEVPRLWRFHFRAALPPRAPSQAS